MNTSVVAMMWPYVCIMMFGKINFIEYDFHLFLSSNAIKKSMKMMRNLI